MVFQSIPCHHRLHLQNDQEKFNGWGMTGICLEAALAAFCCRDGAIGHTRLLTKAKCTSAQEWIVHVVIGCSGSVVRMSDTYTHLNNTIYGLAN